MDTAIISALIGVCAVIVSIALPIYLRRRQGRSSGAKAERTCFECGDKLGLLALMNVAESVKGEIIADGAERYALLQSTLVSLRTLGIDPSTAESVRNHLRSNVRSLEEVRQSARAVKRLLSDELRTKYTDKHATAFAFAFNLSSVEGMLASAKPLDQDIYNQILHEARILGLPTSGFTQSMSQAEFALIATRWREVYRTRKVNA